MSIINHVRKLNRGGNKMEIKYLVDCWGSYSFFGFKDGKQYTEAYDDLDDLVADYPEFEYIAENLVNDMEVL